MLHMVSKFWILSSSLLLVFFTLAPILLINPAHAQDIEGPYTYSTNPGDYVFGWIANGTFDEGSVPVCTYCMNVFTDYLPPGGINYRNLTVGLYRCDGVQFNEKWAYHELTRAIVSYHLSVGALCVDSASYSSQDRLSLQPCNSSSATQRWNWRNNNLVSEIQSEDGKPLLLVGGLPTKEKTDVSQDYSYPLTLEESLPANDGSYTSNFTFLSQVNLVDDSTRRFTTEGLLAMNNGILQNGDFETSTIQAGGNIAWSDYTQSVPSYLSLCGWVIETGPIDYVRSIFSQGEGGYSVHLNTNASQIYSGSISQTVETEVGKIYNLSFYMSPFPSEYKPGDRPGWQCSEGYTQAHLQVQISNATAVDLLDNVESVDGTLMQNFSAEAGTVSSNWQPRSLIFKPSASVIKVLFRSLDFDNPCGPMIDTVILTHHAPPPRKARLAWVLLGSIGGTAILLSLFAVLGFAYWKRYSTGMDKYSDLVKNESAKVYNVKQLSIATNRFSSILGEGAFGTVIKAVFPDGAVRAVKMEKARNLTVSSTVAARASEEISLLLRIHHRNLVNLTGFCISKGRHILVFEYLSNGSLYDRLHQSVTGPPPGTSGADSLDLSLLFAKVLPWDARVRIACEVACGLEYLHHDANPPIVHRDVKSQNILLTSTDFAKLADFGLSKAAPEQATVFQSVETMVRGSFGYMDPQYFSTGVFSTKSDVYSYGVVLLELITGHQAIHNATSLILWAAPFLGDPSAYRNLVDEKLRGRFDEQQLESLVDLSKMCVGDDPKTRPSMRQVVSFLNSKNLVAVIGDSSEQMAKDDGTAISWEEYHKTKKPYSFPTTQPEDFGSGSSEMIRNQLEAMPQPHPRD